MYMCCTVLLNSISIENRKHRYTPIITSVDVCIRAEHGVGASIASGNQIKKNNCADFKHTHKNNKMFRIIIVEICIDKMLILIKYI